MAKNTTEAEVTVTLNGDAARNELKKLEDELKKYRDAAEDAYKHNNKALGDEMTKKAERLGKEFKVTKKEMKDFSDFMKSLNSKSLNELKSAATQLKSQIKGLSPDTQQFIDKTKQLQQVNSRIKQLESSFKGLVAEEKAATFSIKGLADGFNKYFGIATAAIGAITGVSMAFRKCAEDAAMLDDVYSDVMKTTGLTHDEVQALDVELMKLDTRTSREQLLYLARDAGKLGIQGSADVLAFVRAADQIQVALGEDLGEGAIRNLGKIADVLGYTKTMGIEQSLLSIGSAINAVGQSSTASEAYLVDFTQRLAGVAAQAGISGANIIGFASGLDQSAMKVEMAATAFQKFLMKLYEDPAMFARYANMEVEKFSKLLKEDANEAVITILRNLRDQDGFQALVPIFKDMGLDGARAVSVLAAMASNLTAITDAQSLSNVEFEKATSLSNEFTTKNNNMQASLDKARKEFKNASIALGQSLNPIMLKTTNATTYLIKALASYGKEIKAAVISIAALTVLIKGQAIAEGVKAAALKVGNALQATGTVLSNKLAAAYYKLTGQTLKASQAQQAANAAMSKSVYGVIAIAVASLAVATAHFVKKQREANQELDYFESLENKIRSAQNEEISTVQTLINIVNDQNVSYWKRKEALDELKKSVPNYHASLTEEGTLINNNKKALDDYIENLKAVTRMKILEKDYTDVQSKMMAAELAYENATREYWDWRYANQQRPFGIEAAAWDAENAKLGKAQSDAKKALDDIQDKEKKLMRMISLESNNINSVTSGGNNGNSGGSPSGSKDAYSDALKALEAERRAEENAIMQSYANREINEEAYNAEMLRIKTEYLHKKLELAQQEGEDTTQIERQIIQLQLDANKKSYGDELAALKQSQKNEETELKKQLAKNEITQDEYDTKMLELKVNYLKGSLDLAGKYGQDETQTMQAYLDAQVEAEMLAIQQMEKLKKEAEMLAIQQMEKLKKEAKDVKDSLRTPDEVRTDGMATELERLEELHDAKLLSEEEYEKAVQAVHDKYKQQQLDDDLRHLKGYFEKANKVIEGVSEFTSALQSAETAKLEAEYQAQLTAAGDNAEKREAIEAEYEQKKLDLQKKYADVDMVINIAKAIAAGSLAAVEAFAAAGGNPVLGAVYAAIIAATTAAEIATIVAQRNAIKNASAGGGVGSAPETGSRKMTGYAEGGYTEDHTTVTTVGERGREWVAPAWMVRKNPVTFSNLERYRKTGSHGRNGSVSRGFADGGFTESASERIAGGMYTTADLEAAVETAIARSMANGAIRAYLVRNDLTELDAQTDRFKKQTSR